MATLVATHSSYPRIGDRPEQQMLRRSIDRWEKKEISSDDLEQIIRETISEVVTEQERAGVDLVTDGQVRWYDSISHWPRGLKGVKIGGLLRFFDTNTYFRVPRFEKPLERRDSALRLDLTQTLQAVKRPVKAVLTGPVTTALLAERGEGYAKVEDLIHDLTGLLAEEVEGLTAEGAVWIQIDEPLLLKKPEFFPLAGKCLRRLAEKKGKSRILVTTYFADATPFYGKLQDLPVDGLGLDCLYGLGLLEKITKEGTEKVLSLGVIDGRSTRLENVEELVEPLRRIRMAVNDKELQLTTSCGLEYLPRARAFEKLALLAKLKVSLER